MKIDYLYIKPPNYGNVTFDLEECVKLSDMQLDEEIVSKIVTLVEDAIRKQVNDRLRAAGTMTLQTAIPKLPPAIEVEAESMDDNNEPF